MVSFSLTIVNETVIVTSRYNIQALQKVMLWHRTKLTASMHYWSPRATLRYTRSYMQVEDTYNHDAVFL